METETVTEIKILCPTGHLATVPFEEESFYKGLEKDPDFICADSGSSDIGPQPFGSDKSLSQREFQKHDLEHMLLASRDRDIPMIIGSASDTGSDEGVDGFLEIIEEIAAEYNLGEFTVAAIHSEVDKDVLLKKIDEGEDIDGLNNRDKLTKEIINNSRRVLGAVGVDPYIEALDQGADVIIAGRSVDPAIFAAPAIWSGIPEGVAYSSGKILECASLLAEPYAGKESVLGTIRSDEAIFESMCDYQRATPESVSAHAMYERANPYIEKVPRGELDMSECVYESVDEERTRVSGAKFETSNKPSIKLEGVKKVGERALMMIGIRDPYLIENMDQLLDWSRDTVSKKTDNGDDDYQLHYHVYGLNGVMGELEPSGEKSHEVGIAVEAIADTKETANKLAFMAGMSFFYVRVEGAKASSGNMAPISREAMQMNPAYEWTINHVVEVDDPMELCDMKLKTMEDQQ
ncbi:DUF1446 domain-containing protein [Halobacteria archaeon AArc-curdl1]|uniref:DUF1446 domain-containing protein n=1 Tax=Natronosalvus hydrolyticus TaxID=2979988 RepID=A0AAP2Z8G6_9EURY|nr:DUF1446 domain-containing protein [Halobacteria archaeon AArc-curdl1]